MFVWHVVLEIDWTAYLFTVSWKLLAGWQRHRQNGRRDHDDIMFNFKRRRFLLALPDRVVKRFQG